MSHVFFRFAPNDCYVSQAIENHRYLETQDGGAADTGRNTCTALSNVLVILVRCMYASFVLYQNEIYFEFATMSRFASFY